MLATVSVNNFFNRLLVYAIGMNAFTSLKNENSCFYSYFCHLRQVKFFICGCQYNSIINIK